MQSGDHCRSTPQCPDKLSFPTATKIEKTLLVRPRVARAGSACWQRVGELQRVCFEQWDETEEQLSWKRLVEIVEAFQLGKEYKYTPEQLHFHYQPDELLRARHLRRCAVPELVTGT